MIYIAEKKKISVGGRSAPWEEFLNLWVAAPLDKPLSQTYNKSYNL